jgi:hypothetical protein
LFAEYFAALFFRVFLCISWFPLPTIPIETDWGKEMQSNRAGNL